MKIALTDAGGFIARDVVMALTQTDDMIALQLAFTALTPRAATSLTTT